MNIIGLIVLLLLFIFFIRFMFTLFAHLFQVFSWLGADITKIVARLLDVELSAPMKRTAAKAAIEEAEPGDDELGVLVPRRSISVTVAEDTPISEIPEKPEEEVSLLLLFMYALVFLFAGVTNLFLSIMQLPRIILPALRMPFPLRCTIWYSEIFVCILPLVIFSHVPDIYGYGPTINAMYWGLFSYPCFIFLIYLLRIIIPVDMETIFQPHGAGAETVESAPDVVKYRHMIYGILILTVSVIILYRFTIAGLPLICFLFSLMYFLAFGKRGNPGFTIKRFINSWLVFGFLAFLGIAAVHITGIGETLLGFVIPVLLLITLLFVHTLWVMSRKFQLGNSVKEIPIIEVGSWMNQFISPLVKLSVATPMFYFIILFLSIKTTEFYIAAALVTILMTARWKLRRSLPSYMPSGLFAGYVIVVWIAIIFIQSFNRIPPAENSCSSIGNSGPLRRVYTSDRFTRDKRLSGSLPYDAALDSSENALFVTFKNLNGYGSVIRVDPATGVPQAHIVTDNDKYPGEMFYPERLCLNREKKRLYSTTKSDANFQLLDMDYSKGLELSGRIYFGEFETTNCQVDDRNGNIYVIFLGPPTNHFRIIEPGSGKEPPEIDFGRFGYADYFLLDKKRERLVTPSLDPANRFAVYNVNGLKDKDFRVTGKKTPLEFTITGGLKIATPVPTLGIAYNPSSDTIFFSSPFIRMVFEVDAESFKYIRRVRTGRFPREIAVNEKYGILLVANYGDGEVDVFNLDTLERIERLKVGKLVRSITVDEETGRTFIVTGCGVFEYTPASNSRPSG